MSWTESAQVCQFDLFGAKLHALGDIARIDGHGS